MTRYFRWVRVVVRAAGFEPARTRQDAAILEIAVSAFPPRPQIGMRGALERGAPLLRLWWSPDLRHESVIAGEQVKIKTE